MPKQSRVVIVGGGYGGIECAKKLSKRYKNDSSVEISLIDRNPFHTLMTELHEVAGWRSSPESVMVDFESIFPGDRVRKVLDNIKTIDFEKRTVKGANGDYPYDYLVLGSGSEPEYFGIPGIEENSYTLWSLDDALEIRSKVDALFLAASRENDAQERARLLTFVVAGAGFTGIELAGELAEYCDRACERLHIERSEARVLIIEALPAILTMLDEGLRKKAEKIVARLGIELMLSAPISGAEPGLIKIKDGREIRSELFIWTCGVMGTAFAGNLDLTKGRCTNLECPHSRGGSCQRRICDFKTSREGSFVKAKRGRILVKETMESVDYPNVFLTGDALWHLEKERPLPQIVETALQTAHVAAHNLIAAIDGKAERKNFKSNYHGFMVSIGSRFAVSNVKMHPLLLALPALLIMGAAAAVAALVPDSLVKQVLMALNFKPSLELGILAMGWQRMLLALGAGALIVGAYFFALHTALSMGLKHLVNMHYLFGVAGFNAVFNYLRHAFFHREDGRSFWPGRFVAPRVQGLWVAVLRIFTGGMWLLEGFNKLFIEGWLNPKNSGWVNKFLFGIEPVAKAGVEAVSAASGEEWEAAAEPVVEAVSAATGEAVEAVGAALSSVEQNIATAKAAANAAGGIFLPSLTGGPWPIYKWMIKFMLGDGQAPWQVFLAYMMRSVIVLGEVAIGLALLGGAFTFLASGVSLILCLMFVVSGMATREVLWYGFAGLTLLGASGKAAGLDNWIIPYIDKLWRGTKLARHSTLYPDYPIVKKTGRGKKA